MNFSALPYYACGVISLIGLYGMLCRPNLMRKLMGLNIFQTSIILFYLLLAYKNGALAPILASGVPLEAARYINPLPHALMLTAIVVGVSTTGVALALLLRIYRRHGTLEEPDILDSMEGDD